MNLVEFCRNANGKLVRNENEVACSIGSVEIIEKRSREGTDMLLKIRTNKVNEDIIIEKIASCRYETDLYGDNKLACIFEGNLTGVDDLIIKENSKMRNMNLITMILPTGRVKFMVHTLVDSAH